MNQTPQHPNDEAINHVLAALRETSIPRNMERRILNVIEARQAAFSGSAPPRQKLTVFRSVRWVPLASCVALAIVTVSARIMLHTPPTPPPATTTHAPVQTMAIITAGQAVPVPSMPNSHNHTLPHPTPPNSVEASASDDTQSVSHPAPPIPLTDQERLLLRYARRGHTDDLAQITNESRAARDQRDAADFQAFFTPPESPLGESE